MTSLRESPVRRRKPARPPWLIALLIGVAVLVVLGIGYGLISLVRGPGDEAAAEPTPIPTPCETTYVTPAESLPKPAKVTVNVYNATDTSGLASATATDLEKRGFVVGKVTNDPVGKPIPGVAQIRFGPKAAKQAELLLIYVPGAELVELDRSGRKVDLAMGDAYDGLAPEQQVNAALSAPSPVASGIGCPTETGASASPAP